MTLLEGDAKIQDGTLKIVHIINLNEYQNFFGEINSFINNNDHSESMFIPSLKHELTQATEMLESLQLIEEKRKKRSINLIGTAWKYIAGSPDHDDFELLKSNINELNFNNNKQVIINENFSKGINKLTEYTNTINKAIRNENSISNTVIISMQTRLRLVKEKLQNIKYAIQWAKDNIINSVILNKNETNIVIKTLNKEKFPFASTEEALEFANVKVLYKDSILLYVIQIPLTSEEIYKKILIKPIKKDNKIINIDFKEILKIKGKILAIKNNCTITNTVTICKKNDLEDITNSTCIPPFLNGSRPHCDISDAFHTPTVEELKQGSIILNDFHGTLNNKSINGTYLVNFHNESISINNKIFRNIESPIISASPQIVQQSPLEKQYIEMLSLEKLKQFHLNNTSKIKFLETEAIINKSLTITILIILIIIIILSKLFHETKKEIIFHNISTSKHTNENNIENIKITPESEYVPKDTSDKTLNEPIVIISGPIKPPRFSISMFEDKHILEGKS